MGSYAGHRQGRIHAPDTTRWHLPNPQFPTELQGRYDVAVFDNRFPSLTLAAHDPPQCIVDTLLLMALARS